MPVEKRWTLCTTECGKVRKYCQYKTKSRADAHAASNGDGWFVALYPVNPQRRGRVGGRRSTEVFRKVGLPQYD